jgi:hypothetical protein
MASLTSVNRLTANKKNPSRHLDCLFYVSRLFYFKESKVCVFVMSRIVLCLVKYPLLHCELRYVERSLKMGFEVDYSNTLCV